MTDEPSFALDQLRAQRAALADFGLFAFKCDDLDALLRRAAELVSDAMQIDLVKILEHHPDRGELLIRCGVNWQPGVVGHVAFADHEHSPAGYALQTREPVVSPDLDTETRFEIPEVLVRHGVRSMVNVIIAGARQPFGVLEVDARERRDFGADDVAFLRNYANLLAGAIDRLHSHGKLEDNAREQDILTQELRHRSQNLLAVMQALVSQTSEEGRSAADLKEVLLSRIRAFAAAEEVVFEQQVDAVDMGKLALAVLAPFVQDRADAIEIAGDPLLLPARAARMIGLALHELATNAAKYGALSRPGGHVRIECRAGPNGKELLWSELGGPPVVPPSRIGFGTRLLRSILPGEVGGDVDLTHPPAGVRFRLSIPPE